MAALEDVLRDANERYERGSDLVREVCVREGASTVVATVAGLVESSATHHGEALRFLVEGADMPDLRAAIQGGAELRKALESALASSDLRARLIAIAALRDLPVASAGDLLAAAALEMVSEEDVIGVAEVLSVVEVPPAVMQMFGHDDWLVRWALLPWTNSATESSLADGVRKRLASDRHPLVAAEAGQHVALLAKNEAASLRVVSNHGPAPSFRRLTQRFVADWPAEKKSYTVDELRTFVLARTSKEVS